MTLILRWLSGALGPWILAAAAALMLAMGTTIARQAWTNHSLRADLGQAQATLEHERAEYAEAGATFEALARVREHQRAEEVAELYTHFHQENVNARSDTDRTIAGLRAGTLQLRERLAARTCPGDLSGAAGAAGGAAAAGEAGLRRDDADVLVRLADRADDVARRLNLCIAIAKKEREK